MGVFAPHIGTAPRFADPLKEYGVNLSVTPNLNDKLGRSL